MWGLRDPILDFWDPLISREWLKAKTSNLAWRLTAVSLNKKNAKLGQKGSCGGHVSQFWNFVRHPRNISGTVKPGNFKFDTETDDSEL